MAYDDPKTLVSTEWLAAHLKDPDLRILDASWYMPAEARDAKAEFAKAHIPNARFFDIDDISDLQNKGDRGKRSAAPAPRPRAARQVECVGLGDH